MGEETDGVVESVSKMQEKIKALSGIDILTDAGDYKDTYTILREIGNVWEDMSDIDQAALLELMAGKNRANTLSAILSNMKDLEGAYESAIKAEGSAFRENEAYLDSIQGRIDLFTNSLQTMWMNAVDSDIVKFIVDLGTAVLKLVDTLGLVPTLIVGFTGFSVIKSIFNGISDYTDLIGDTIKSGEILTSTNQKLVASTIAEQVSLDLANSSLVKYAITSGIVTSEQVAQMTTTELLGTAFLGLVAKIKSATIAMAKFLFTTPVGWSILAVAAITSVIVAYNAFGPTHDNFVKKLNEETDAIKTVQSELQSLQSELKTTKDRIEELEEKGTLSFVEEEELNRLKQQTAELERQEAILLAQEKRAKNKQIDSALKAVETDPYLTDHIATTGSSYAAVAHAQQNTYTTGTPYAAGLQYANSKDNINSENLGNSWEINLNNLKDAKEDLDAANKELAETTYDVESKEYAALEEKVSDAKARVDKYNDIVDSMNETWKTEYGEVGYVENATTEEEKAWNEFYRKHQDYLDQQALINDSYGKSTILDRVFGVTGTDVAKEFKDKFESIVKSGGDPAEVIESLLSNINYSSAFASLENQFGITLDDIKNYFTQTGEFVKKVVDEGDVAVGQAYSTLSTSVEKYISINEILNETIYDNIEISKDQYDALNDLVGSEEEYADCIDESNGYIVKNSALLRKLVAQKKQEQKATVQQAKSASQLQYKNTVQQLQQVINAMALEVKANGLVSSSTLNTVGILREQLTALKQTIQQYALLELSLSDAANAYSEFEAAKERDAQLTYGDSMIEALQTINDGFKTGQVGTEAFQYAVKIFVPESEYAHIDDIEQRMIAIHDYIDKNPLFADWFTIDEGEFSITLDNINNFIDDAFGAGLFTNDSSGNFFLTDEIKNAEEPLKEFADQLSEAFGTEVTEGSVLAMLTEMEKYDASWGNIITDLTTTPLDRAINDATDALDKALTAQEEFIRSGGNLNSDEYKRLEEAVTSARRELDKASQAATDNAKVYTTVEAVLKGVSGEVKYTQEQANSLARSLDLVNENGVCTININEDGTLSLTQSQVDILNKRLTGLTKPTILDIQLAYDEIDADIAATEKKISDLKDSLTIEGLPQSEIDFINTEINQLNGELDKLTADRDAIELVYNITKTSSEQDTDTIEKLTTWETNGVNIVITGDTTSLDGTVSEVNAIEIDEKEVSVIADPTEANANIDSVDENNIADKESTIAMQGVYTAINDINSIGDALDDLAGTRYVTIAVNYDDSESGGSSANGNFHISGGAFSGGTMGAPRTETALTGELGPEMIVRGNRWFTVGDNGAEFTQIKKGDIIFNHKQTEDLLSKGYVTSRGKMTGGAFASGTAYYRTFDAYVGDNDVFENGSENWMDPYTNTLDSLSDAADSISDAADGISDVSDEFREVFDWVEVRLEEIDEAIGLLEASLENAVYYNEKNNIIDKIIDVNNTKLENLKSGYEEYSEYANGLLTKIPEQYREAAKNGTIAIEEFVGEADEATLEAINNYREWAQKAADLKQQAQEVITTIRDLAIQKFDNAYKAGDVRATVEDSQTEKLQNQVDLLEEMGEIASSVYYGINGGDAASSTGMFENSYKKIEYLTEARKAMQEELNAAVEAGQIERGSNEWYELIDQMYQIDSQIHEATRELEEFQNAINDIYWDNFEQFTNRIDYLKDETQSLIDLMDNADMVTKPEGKTYDGGTVKFWTEDDVKWTDEGIASLGLYAQQMEIAEYQAKQYAGAIDDLTKDYKKGLYSENEYIEKLEELKDAQYENIEAYYEAQDAIVELNEARVDSIKDGIEKEIDAYEELIENKKKALDAEKDLYDFQKSTSEQQKNIAQIERQLAALANDTSLSAAAKRKQLEAELAEAQYELQDTYYNRSVEDKQTALDKELEDFQAEKDAELVKWDEYLTNVELVVAESLTLIQENASGVYDTLNAKAQEYDLTLSDAIMTPWQDGALAVSDYQDTFNTAMSSTMNQLDALKNKWQEVIDKMAETAKVNVDNIHKENANYATATKKEPETAKPNTSTSQATKPQTQEKQITVGGKINAGSARIYASSNGTGGGKQYFASDPIYTVLQEKNGYLLVRHHKSNSGSTGWFKKSDVKAYAKGTTNLKNSGIINIDELGEELVLRAQNGRLTYMEKGSGIVPADLTSNLMEWGKLDPTTMLEQNRPSIGVHPEIHNTEVNINMTYGDILHIDEFSGNNPEDVAKLVAKQFEKHTKDLNNALRKFAR